jgi:putative membrane protein
VFGVIRMWFFPREVREVGSTPDYRFSLANERTFLAWIRTALAMVGGGLAVAQFVPQLAIPHVREIAAAGLILVGAVAAVRAVDHWVRSELAMRRGEPLPASRFPAILAILVFLGSLLVLAAILV